MIANIVTQTIRGWNKQVLTEIDFFNVLRKKNAHYIETDLISGAGEYLVHRGKEFILINSLVPRRFKAWVQWHELGHLLFHVPGHFSKHDTLKSDLQANMIAAVALMPLVMLEKYSVGEILEFYDYPEELIEYRLLYFERYGK